MPTQNNLLIRIDERQKEMARDMSIINNKLDLMVLNNEEYKDLKRKVSTLWDERNKLIGWMLGAGLVGGTTGALVKQLVSTVFAKF